MSFNEAVIRDKLSSDLSVLEPGLVLEAIEKYLPSAEGSRGFVDILARDKNGKYVLIELKRSDAAARQAIHEVLKYIDGIKNKFALKGEELRVFIVSTEWRELIVPFSSFVNDSGYRLKGFKLEVDSFGVPISSSVVSPIKTRSDRLFTPWHEISRFSSMKSMRKGIESYKNSCSAKGIKDYVLICLKAPLEQAEKDRRKKYNKIHALFSGAGEMRSYEEVSALSPLLNYMTYFAMIQLDVDYCLKRLDRILVGEDKVEWNSNLKYLDESSMLGESHERLMGAGPSIHRDDFEIAYPAKFVDKVSSDDWVVKEILRFGALSENDLLVDETIISEICGEQGNTGQRYKKILSAADLMYMDSVYSEIKSCLAHNPQWCDQIIKVLEGIGRRKDVTVVDISIFNPGHILLSFYLALTTEESFACLPMYFIKIGLEAGEEVIFGILEDCQKNPSMSKLLQERYDGNMLSFLMPLNWGGYDRDDAYVVRDIGLSYGTYSHSVDEAGQATYKKLTAFGFEECEIISFSKIILEYVERNKVFFDDVVGIYSTYWDGVMFQFSSDDEYIFLS